MFSPVLSPIFMPGATVPKQASNRHWGQCGFASSDLAQIHYKGNRPPAAWAIRCPASGEEAPTVAGAKSQSGAQNLAATTTTGAQDFAATGGRLAGEETVAAGAHEIARLKSALHLEIPTTKLKQTKRAAKRKAASHEGALTEGSGPSQDKQRHDMQGQDKQATVQSRPARQQSALVRPSAASPPASPASRRR